MSERTITITEKDGRYQLQNSGLSRFETVGLLECVLFDLKTSVRREEGSVGDAAGEKAFVEESKPETSINQNKENSDVPAAEPPLKEIAQAQHQEPGSPDIRTRIGNAVRAIRSLGGEVSEADLSAATDDELQAELEELKNQYKRLKSSQKPK